jgi:hypothetical protein
MIYAPRRGLCQDQSGTLHQPQLWEPEPLRWLGVRVVRRGLMRIDDEAERTGHPPAGRSLAERLGSH